MEHNNEGAVRYIAFAYQESVEMISETDCFKVRGKE